MNVKVFNLRYCKFKDAIMIIANVRYITEVPEHAVVFYNKNPIKYMHFGERLDKRKRHKCERYKCIMCGVFSQDTFLNFFGRFII